MKQKDFWEHEKLMSDFCSFSECPIPCCADLSLELPPGSTVKVTFYINLSAQTNSNFRSAGSQLLPNYIIGTIAFGKSLY